MILIARVVNLIMCYSYLLIHRLHRFTQIIAYKKSIVEAFKIKRLIKSVLIHVNLWIIF
jgi:hypothetical protein